MNIFKNPDDYVMSCLNQFPALYCSKSFDDAKMKVFNQLFNVIGNGVRDNEDLIEMLRVRRFNREKVIPLYTGGKMLMGYKDTVNITMMSKPLVVGNGSPIYVNASEKDAYPDCVHWEELTFREVSLYPNFKKKYSTVWYVDYKSLGKEWCDAIVWFYTKCKEWFVTNESKYHYAFPCSYDQKTQKSINDMEEYRTTKYSSDEEFSKAYGLEYLGDMNDFLIRKWEKEKARIMEFIDETIAEYSNVTSK